MPSESDGTKRPENREKSAKSEDQSQSKPDAKDNSKLQSQSTTGSKPFMIYPIPKAGAHDETDHPPAGMTYDEVLAKNSPGITPDQKASPVESTASAAAASAAAAAAAAASASPSLVPADNPEISKSHETRSERVPRTLIDFEVPQTDKLDSSPAHTAASDVGHAVVSRAHENAAPNTDQNSTPNAVSHALPTITPNIDNESSAAALSRIAGSQAINHEKDSPAVRPPEVPPPMRRKRSAPKTMLDILVRVGNQLTGAGHAPEVPPEVQANSEDAESKATAYYSNEAHYPAPDYSDLNEQQTFYQGADGQLAGPEEPRGERISRTLLDHSIMADIGSKSAEKMVLKAAEDLKEKRNEPFVPFIPVVEDRIASPCPWKWEGTEGKDRVKYCDKCQHQVYNFAGIERPEANALIFKRENVQAKTLFKRADGKFMTSDCPVAVKQTRSMVLAVVVGLGCMILVFAAMLLAPQQPKQQAVKQEDAPSEQPTSSSAREGRGSSSNHGRSDSTTANTPTQTPPAGGNQIPPPVSTYQPTGSNGGYGPLNAPTPATNDFQWNYPSDADKNAAPVSAPQAAPSAPRIGPDEAAELERLKQPIIDSGSK